MEQRCNDWALTPPDDSLVPRRDCGLDTPADPPHDPCIGIGMVLRFERDAWSMINKCLF